MPSSFHFEEVVNSRGPPANRWTRRYNTTSNRTRVVKTPGGELRVLHIKKRGTAPKCGDCGIKLPGVSSFEFMREDGIFMGEGYRKITSTWSTTFDTNKSLRNHPNTLA